MTSQATTLWLAVTDDGVGVDSAAPGGAGRGLLNLGDRLGAIGGALELTTLSRGGLAVRAVVPLPR